MLDVVGTGSVADDSVDQAPGSVADDSVDQAPGSAADDSVDQAPGSAADDGGVDQAPGSAIDDGGVDQAPGSAIDDGGVDQAPGTALRKPPRTTWCETLEMAPKESPDVAAGDRSDVDNSAAVLRRQWPGSPRVEQDSLGQRVADAVVQAFCRLPRTAKPQPHEHTVLAGFVVSEEQGPARAGAQAAACPLRVLALATGTKCLAGSARDDTGLCLHDCHAEVLARRALLLYLHAEARELLCRDAASGSASDSDLGPLTLLTLHRRSGVCNHKGDSEMKANMPAALTAPTSRALDTPSDWGWELRLRDDVRLHMFTSMPPCGDACVVHGVCDAGQAGAGFTGAKLLGVAAAGNHGEIKRDAGQGPRPPPVVVVREEAWADGPQETGCLRRKPGRGESTWSMSCSDKLARWRLLGVQGGLWTGLLHGQRLHLASVTACAAPWTAAMEASTAAFTRALVSRFDGVLAQSPGNGTKAYHSPLSLELLPPLSGELAGALGLAPSTERRSACGASLLWHAGVPGSNTAVPYLEGLTGVLGLRAGHRRSTSEAPSPKAASAACRARLGLLAAELLRLLRRPAGASEELVAGATENETYDELKAALSGEYAADWRRLRATEQFQAWIPKPPATFVLHHELAVLPPSAGCKRRRR